MLETTRKKYKTLQPRNVDESKNTRQKPAGFTQRVRIYGKHELTCPNESAESKPARQTDNKNEEKTHMLDTVTGSKEKEVMKLDNGVPVTDVATGSEENKDDNIAQVSYKQDHNRAFSSYDNSFQEKVFHVLIYDREWAQEISEVMTPNMFDSEHLRWLAGLAWDFFYKYKGFPSLDIFKTNIKEKIDELDPGLRAQVIDYLPKLRLRPDPSDAAFVKDKVESFCRKQNFKDAFMRGIELMKHEKYDAIYSIMRNAVSASTSGSKGHDFHAEREARWSGIDRTPVPTGMVALDNLIQGGLSGGELAVVVAATGVGKSHWLVNVGGEAVTRGKNVIHYTFELSEHETGRRYDAWFSGIDSREILARKSEVEYFYQQKEAQAKKTGEKLGGLIIKEFPTGTASVVTLKSHIERLRLTEFYPDMIIVDYADIMKSAGGGSEGERFKQKAIYEELRALSKEMQIPIWTASQSNREGAAAEVITSENMSESYGKAMVADLIVSLSRKAMEKANGTARMFLTKSRLGPDGVMFNIDIDTSLSRFVGEQVTRTLHDLQEEEKRMKKDMADSLLRDVSKKWNHVRGELTTLERIDRGE